MTEGFNRVFCIGETVLDIIFQDNKPIAATPGGSMLNSAVSLGRAGIPVHFISDFATDHAGNFIHDFLFQNGVSTTYTDRYSNGKTSLALAFLDDNQNADYSFYKLFPEDRLQISMPDVHKGDIILFGSYYVLTTSIREKVMKFVRKAKKNGAFIIYDPNFRKAHIDELEIVRPWILENMALASLVRGSDDDFRLIFGAASAADAFTYVAGAGCPVLIYTKNKDGVEVVMHDRHYSYEVAPVMPVSTIGAGDAFNAGIIFSLLSNYATRIGSANMNGVSWDTLINHGIRFSENVCMSLENYISVEFGNLLKNG